jgi:Spy/CpxP family protein refolding chaperone
MRKLTLLIAALSLASSLPAMAQSASNTRQGDRQDIGGHFRYQHRDWSKQEGHHVHSVCWDWDPGEGWVWDCNE